LLLFGPSGKKLSIQKFLRKTIISNRNQIQQ